jgi:hypothetical protein
MKSNFSEESWLSSMSFIYAASLTHHSHQEVSGSEMKFLDAKGNIYE